MKTPDNQNGNAKAGSLDSMVRRRRVINVPEDYVLALLSRGLVHGQFILVPEPLGLPDTARVVGVWNDWARMAWVIVVQDPSFDEVPDAGLIPEMKVRWSYVEVAVKAPNPQPSPASL